VLALASSREAREDVCKTNANLLHARQGQERMHFLDKTLRRPLNVDGAAANKSTTYAADIADTWLAQLGYCSTDLDGIDTYRSDARHDRISDHDEHVPGATLTMVLAGVGMVTIVACRPAAA